MILVKPSFEILQIMGEDSSPLYLIEAAGRTCYKLEDKMTLDSHQKFAQSILKNGHESVIEHSAMTVRFIVDRGVTHELVRHRLCAFSQESTRYCNYKGGVTFIIPPWLIDVLVGEYCVGVNSSFEYRGMTDGGAWMFDMQRAENAYLDKIARGWTPQQARSVLPNSLKTEIVVTANFREWRHVFKLRCSKAAHPQMQEIMIPLRDECKELIPIIFEDLE